METITFGYFLKQQYASEVSSQSSLFALGILVAEHVLTVRIILLFSRQV